MSAALKTTSRTVKNKSRSMAKKKLVFSHDKRQGGQEPSACGRSQRRRRARLGKTGSIQTALELILI
jgi:hypothetical protein